MSKRDLQLKVLARMRTKIEPDTPEAAKLDAIETAVRSSSDAGADPQELKAAAAEQPPAEPPT